MTLTSGIALAGSFDGIHPLQSDRFIFGIGAYSPEIDGNYYFDDGLSIDFQGDAGFDDHDTLPAAAAT